MAALTLKVREFLNVRQGPVSVNQESGTMFVEGTTSS